MDKTNVTALTENIENELNIIAEKGLNQSNFDTCYRLVDMLFKLSMIKPSCNQNKTCYDDYINAKRMYKHSHTPLNHDRIIESLKYYMSDIMDNVSNALNDCDCEEEKDIIINYLSKI